MEQKRNLGAIGSSEDVTKIADTVKGLIVGASSLIIFIGALKGITVTQDGILAFAQQAGATIGAWGTALGAIWTLYGLIKKGLVAYFAK